MIILIIYELKEGKGYINEYYDDKLLFEGEYLNGIKNGKGREYYDDGLLIFEGEYINGKRNGKAKEYDNNPESFNLNQLIFEGELLDGKRNGKGKEYSRRQIIFEGEYLNSTLKSYL